MVVGDLQLGDQKVTLNHLVLVVLVCFFFFAHLAIISVSKDVSTLIKSNLRDSC